MTVWRIEKRRYLETVLSGEGARLYGGRWNSIGRPVVYASENLSLSALEKLVHLDRPGVRSSFWAIGIEIPTDTIQHVEASSLPRNWSSELDFESTRSLGDQWITDNQSLALSVPSSLIHRELNYLLNPRHSRFHQARIVIQEPFTFDPRLTV